MWILNQTPPHWERGKPLSRPHPLDLGPLAPHVTPPESPVRATDSVPTTFWTKVTPLHANDLGKHTVMENAPGLGAGMLCMENFFDFFSWFYLFTVLSLSWQTAWIISCGSRFFCNRWAIVFDLEKNEGMVAEYIKGKTGWVVQLPCRLSGRFWTIWTFSQ